MTRLAARMRLMDATLDAGVLITNVSQWCRENGVNPRTFYRHRARIRAEGSWQPRSRRPRRFPGITGPEVTALVIALRAELVPDNGADAIIASLRQVAAAQDWAGRGLAVPHRSTVNKILKRSGLVKPQPRKRPKSSYRRFAYARPRDCYQIDACGVKLADGTPAAVFDVLDDCSRLLAACTAAPAETAVAAAAAIQAAAVQHGPPGIVLCDNGTAFSGGRARGQGAFARAVTTLGSRIIHSSPYHPQTCGKVERHHQTLKKWLATRPAPATLADLQALLDEYRDYYNNRRHHTAVRTTPARAWHAAQALGGPGQLPRQDDATVHRVTVAENGTIRIGPLKVSVGRDRAGQRLTAIRDHDRVTAYTPDGTPLGHITLNYHATHQGTLTPAA